jgi:type IV pilus biogenesis protein PilP
MKNKKVSTQIISAMALTALFAHMAKAQVENQPTSDLAFDLLGLHEEAPISTADSVVPAQVPEEPVPVVQEEVVQDNVVPVQALEEPVPSVVEETTAVAQEAETQAPEEAGSVVEEMAEEVVLPAENISETNAADMDSMGQWDNSFMNTANENQTSDGGNSSKSETNVQTPDNVFETNDSFTQEEEKEVPTMTKVTDISLQMPSQEELDFKPIDTDVSDSASPSEKLLGKIPTDVFQQMADLERGNVLLKLQMEKQQLSSDLETLKASYRQARLEEIEKREGVVRERVKWLQDQEVNRQTILAKEKQLELMNKQIEEAALRKEELRREAQVRRLEEERRRKQEEEDKKRREEEEAKRKAQEEEEERQMKEMMAQAGVSVVQGPNGMIVQQGAMPGMPQEVQKKEPPKVARFYRVTEIKGTGDSLTARLTSLNEEGPSFLVKKGSKLLTGHTVKSISKDNVVVEMDGVQETLGVGIFLPEEDMLNDGEKESKQNAAGNPQFSPMGMKGPRAISFP